MLTIKIVGQGSIYQFTAEVTAPQGSWSSPHPIPLLELRRKLFAMGLDKGEIENAEAIAYHEYFMTEVNLKASHEHAKINYGEVEKKYLPFIQAALAGEREVPAQGPFAVGWLAYSLLAHHTNEELHPLWEVLFSADAENHAIPNYDEISWAFLWLRRRGWLAVEGDMFGLTPEGSRAVKEIVDKDEPPWPDWTPLQWTAYVLGHVPRINRTWALKKLEDWILKNPPPRNGEKARKIRR